MKRLSQSIQQPFVVHFYNLIELDTQVNHLREDALLLCFRLQISVTREMIFQNSNYSQTPNQSRSQVKLINLSKFRKQINKPTSLLL